MKDSLLWTWYHLWNISWNYTDTYLSSGMDKPKFHSMLKLEFFQFEVNISWLRASHFLFANIHTMQPVLEPKVSIGALYIVNRPGVAGLFYKHLRFWASIDLIKNMQLESVSFDKYGRYHVIGIFSKNFISVFTARL